MKIKKISRKLVFNKETIAHLGNIEIKQILGGGNENPPASAYNSGCQACPTYTCAPSECSGLYCC